MNKGLFYVFRHQFNSSGDGCADFCAEAGADSGVSSVDTSPCKVAMAATFA